MKDKQRKVLPAVIYTTLIASAVDAQDQQLKHFQNNQPDVSPVRGIERKSNPIYPNPPRNPRVRSIDGSGNNQLNPSFGEAEIPLIRISGNDYGDQISAMAGSTRPSARFISNQISAQTDSQPNPLGLSDYLWQWGQFLDHDIDLTDGVDPVESVDILVPTGDIFFDPTGTGNEVISFNRSIYDPTTGTSIDNPRQQINEITAWIDGSNVYGSDEERAAELRLNDGSGKLKTSKGNLLPFNEAELPNAGGSSNTLFLAGDVRANEQAGLASMHTLFVREHNRLAEQIAIDNPRYSDEQIYQEARMLVGAQLQVITYQEFLPALLGPNAIPVYTGYKAEVNSSISNEFSSAAYRFGHSLLSPLLLRLDSNMEEIEPGHLSLADAFFAPSRLTTEGGIEPILRGLSAQICQDFDVLVIDEVRNFLFGPPGAGGFDLASLNIQRGRDHGLPGYNDVREAYGLPRINQFSQISDNSDVNDALAASYNSPDEIDLWLGGLAETARPQALVGDLVFTILSDQFTRLRDGDRFWYARILRPQQVAEIEATTLAQIIRRNTNIGNEIPDDVFRVNQTFKNREGRSR